MISASVIVRAHNEERHLPYLLERLRKQNGMPVEIVVVDSGSTDRTVDIAQREADRLVHIAPQDFTFGRSLNLGCGSASGEILAIVSAHAYPSSNNWLPNLVEPFADPNVAMVYGRQLRHARSRMWESRDLAVTYPPYSRTLHDEPVGNNANSAVRASLWAEHRFDESLTGLEDLEWARWAQRQGFTVRYAADAPIVHIHEESPHQVYRRHLREGMAHAELFPEPYQTLSQAAVVGLLNIARDLRYGRTNGASLRELAVTPVYRGSAVAGFRRGRTRRARRRREAAQAAVRRPLAQQRAVVVSGAGKHGLQSRPTAHLSPGELAIRVAYVGVCTTDIEIADGEQVYYRSGRATYPIVPGHEYSGVVEAAGSPELQSWVGRRVVAECAIGCGRCAHCLSGCPSRCPRRRETGVLGQDGAYATRVALPSRVVHPIPDDLPLLHAALVEPTAVVLKALRKLRTLHGAHVAVVGAGPIGHLAAQVIRALGADDILVIDRDQERLRPFTGMAYSTATEISAGNLDGFGAVIEATGSRAAVEEIAGHSPDGAQVIVLGDPGEDDAPVPVASPGRRTVIGSLASDSPDWPWAIEVLRARHVDVRWLVSRVYPLAEYASAWESARRREHLKTILLVEPELAGE